MSSADPELNTENQKQRTRLIALAGRMGDRELEHPLGSGWTVSTALAHMAFWDRRAALILERWARGQVPPADEPDWYGGELLNESLLAEWQALPGRDAVRLALEAADAIDGRVAQIDSGLAAEIVASGEAWLLRRGRHRREHLHQIESGLVAG